MAAMPNGLVDGYWLLCRDHWLAQTKISNKNKELIAIAVAAATRCQYCVFFHTLTAKLFGATDEEIADAGAVSAEVMFASTFIWSQGPTNYEQFKAETVEIINYVKRKASPN